jgi:predicted nucleotidyltransferase
MHKPPAVAYDNLPATLRLVQKQKRREFLNLGKVEMNALNQQIDQIREACSINQVKRLFAFGSVTRNELRENSDIDLVVEIDESDPLSYTDYYFDLKEKLENLLKRPIDLLEEKAIRNPLLRSEIDKTKVLIYGE